MTRVCVLTFAGCLLFVHRAAADQRFIVTVPTANVRMEPTVSSPAIARVERGHMLDVAEVVKDWVKVVIPDEKGLKKVGYIRLSLGKLEVAQKTASEDAENLAPRPERSSPDPPPIAPVPAPQAGSVEKPNAGATSKEPATGEQLRTTRIPPAPRGRFGVGVQFAASPSGAAPSILYDFRKNLRIRGIVNAGTGFFAGAGQLLLRFPSHDKPDSAMNFEPYLGGGPVLVQVRYGGLFGSESFIGAMGSGGVSIQVKAIPRWRFSGDLNWVQFNFGRFAEPAVYGLYVGIGVHYFFGTAQISK